MLSAKTVLHGITNITFVHNFSWRIVLPKFWVEENIEKYISALVIESVASVPRVWAGSTWEYYRFIYTYIEIH